MSLSSAITNALSGMRAVSAAADITGSNLANATNENYARRDLVVQADTSGARGGVQIVGVERQNNPVLSAAWRNANSETAMMTFSSENASEIQSLYGDPTQIGSLANKMNAFHETLISAAARPDLTERLSASVVSLDRLVQKVNAIGDGIQAQRESADRRISSVATRLNDTLADLDTLNKRILSATSQGKDVSSFLDQQDKLVDELSGMTDIRVFQRDKATIAIYSSGGAVLLDDSPAEIAFSPSGTVTAHLSNIAGTLASLTVNGEPVDVARYDGRLRGGELGALFDFRDVSSVTQQNEIDAFAFNLAQRLNDPSIDPTRQIGDVGFLTDHSGEILPGSLVGLSSRLNVNTNIDPQNGGEPTLLRDGLRAANAGPVGNSALVQALSDQLTDVQPISFGNYAGETLGLDSFAIRLTNQVAFEMNQAEDAQVFASSQSDALHTHKLETAVDSDAELQKLMLLEQAYAANAQVLRSVDEMMDTLLGVV